MRRMTLTPDDMARGFMSLYRGGAVEGLFLSSGVIRGGVTSQDSILDVGAILREKYDFRGYMHLKIMPGAERDQVQRAMQLANRVSINLEAPNAERLERIAPGKRFEDELLTRLRWVEELRQQTRLTSSSTTELVVGPAGERDVEILSTTEFLHRQLKLARVYFSAFRPIPDTPLDNEPATDPARQFRLYQASFLLRDYEFDVEELPFRPGWKFAHQRRSETRLGGNPPDPRAGRDQYGGTARSDAHPGHRRERCRAHHEGTAYQ